MTKCDECTVNILFHVYNKYDELKYVAKDNYEVKDIEICERVVVLFIFYTVFFL